MAKVIGTSRAWKSILSMLADVNLRVEYPREIKPLLDDLKKQFGEKLAEAREQIQQQLEPITAEVEIEKENIEKGSAGRLAELAENIHETQLTLELYQLDKGLFGRVRNLYRIRRQEKKLHGLETERDEVNTHLKRLLDEQDNILAERHASIEAEIVRQYEDVKNKVVILEKVEASKELAEALIEMEMLEQLRALPDNTRVINAVDLETEQAVRLEGKSFWRVQIDHLVITPSGLFAIKIHHGGKQDSKDSTDPFEQAKRASHLCYELLKHDFPGITVRAVLAHRGHVRENQQSAYVKTLPINEVAGYIYWFKDNTLSEASIEKIVSYFQESAQ
jgi:hypothetical protein